MAVAVAAPVAIGLAAEAVGGGGGDGCGARLGVAGSEVPLPVEVDGKGAPPVEGVPVAVTAGGKEKEKEEEEEDEEEKKKKKEKGQGVRWLGHYSSAQDILLVGDGDFSFSLALATAFGSGTNLVATSLDTYETLKSKYGKAESNITELKRLSATVLHGVDTKEMKSHPYLKKRRFDRIVFNFPHAGFKGKEDDMHMINSHRELVWGFFNNALHLLRPYCEIHISHKAGGAYDRWDIEDLAFRASLVLVEKVAFQQEDYPGYNQKRGDSARSDEAFDLGICFTFMFRIRDLNWKKLNGDMASSVGIMAPATERGPFHLFPPDEAWPRQRLPPPVNTVHMLTTMKLDGVAQSQHPDFALNFDGTVRDSYFQQPGNFGPGLRTPGSFVNALHNLGGAICPPMGRIPCPDLLAPQEKPWYKHRPTADAPGRDHCYLAWENQWGLQRECETQGHVIPVESHSALLEHQPRDWEFVQKDRLRRMVMLYGGMW